MAKNNSIIIFTDLDGTLLNRDTFKFDSIKDYLKKLHSKGIKIIPNSSKTEKEILEFNQELGLDLPYISENGSVIKGMNLINSNFPNEIILSRDKDELLKIFEKTVSENLKEKCGHILDMSKKRQVEIFGLTNNKLKNATKRKYSIPMLFKGNKFEKNELVKLLKTKSLTFQDGGRVQNLCDNVNKVKAMNKVLKIFKKIQDNTKVIGVGDNYNDLEMLRNCDIPCLVFNDQFKEDQINIENLIFSNQPAPEGWADVVKKAIVKVV